MPTVARLPTIVTVGTFSGAGTGNRSPSRRLARQRPWPGGERPSGRRRRCRLGKWTRVRDTSPARGYTRPIRGARFPRPRPGRPGPCWTRLRRAGSRRQATGGPGPVADGPQGTQSGYDAPQPGSAPYPPPRHVPWRPPPGQRYGQHPFEQDSPGTAGPRFPGEQRPGYGPGPYGESFVGPGPGAFPVPGPAFAPGAGDPGARASPDRRPRPGDHPATRHPASFPAGWGKGRDLLAARTRPGRGRQARSPRASNRPRPATTRRACPGTDCRSPVSSSRLVISMRARRSLERRPRHSPDPAGPVHECPDPGMPGPGGGSFGPVSADGPAGNPRPRTVRHVDDDPDRVLTPTTIFAPGSLVNPPDDGEDDRSDSRPFAGPGWCAPRLRCAAWLRAVPWPRLTAWSLRAAGCLSRSRSGPSSGPAGGRRRPGGSPEGRRPRGGSLAQVTSQPTTAQPAVPDTRPPVTARLGSTTRTRSRRPRARRRQDFPRRTPAARPAVPRPAYPPGYPHDPGREPRQQAPGWSGSEGFQSRGDPREPGGQPYSDGHSPAANSPAARTRATRPGGAGSGGLPRFWCLPWPRCARASPPGHGYPGPARVASGGPPLPRSGGPPRRVRGPWRATGTVRGVPGVAPGRTGRLSGLRPSPPRRRTPLPGRTRRETAGRGRRGHPAARVPPVRRARRPGGSAPAASARLHPDQSCLRAPGGKADGQPPENREPGRPLLGPGLNPRRINLLQGPAATADAATSRVRPRQKPDQAGGRP